MKKYIIYIIALFVAANACTELDLPPKSIISDEDLYNDVGIEAYMAGMYRMLPMNDFKTSDDGGSTQGYFHWNCTVWETNGTGEGFGKNNTGGITLHRKDYWNEGWKIVRNANRMITNLPSYENTLVKANEWIAEAKFIRAYVYFTLCSRYGGLPIIPEMQDFDSEFSNLWVARSSCEETWDFILSDLDAAIAGLPETYGNALTNRTRATKNVALAFKARAAIFAASIAKYGGGKSSGIFEESRNFCYYSKTDPSLMLCGIPESKANDYYKQAWEAAKALEGKFSLVGQDAASPTDKETAYTKVFSEADSNSEAIFIRKYSYNDYAHSFDIVYSPARHVGTYGSRYMLTLDWMELFDGKHPVTGRNFVDPETGKLNVMDGEYYHVYNSAAELYEGTEPRLRASILVPMQTYRGAKTDLRWGVIDESVDPSQPITKVYPDNYFDNGDYNATNWPFYTEKILRFAENQNPVEQSNFVVLSTGEKIPRNGYDGPGPSQWGDYNRTGIWGQKWLDMRMTKANLGAVHTSSSSWIDIRYSEVLLNRAEAAIEMFQNGYTGVAGTDMQQDAFNCINLVRQRAGADLLANKSELSTSPAFDRQKNATVMATNPGKGGFVFAPNRGIQIVRVERYKEFNYEHKLYWDLRRWFSFDLQINAWRARSIIPFMFAKGAFLTAPDGQNFLIPDGKYIYDLRGALSFDRKTFSITGDRSYYENIPSAEMAKNPLLEGNVRQ